MDDRDEFEIRNISKNLVRDTGANEVRRDGDDPRSDAGSSEVFLRPNIDSKDLS